MVVVAAVVVVKRDVLIGFVGRLCSGLYWTFDRQRDRPVYSIEIVEFAAVTVVTVVAVAVVCIFGGCLL